MDTVEDNTLLSLRIVERYNYAESKKEIDKIMLDFEMARYKYSELPQPTITPNYEIILMQELFIFLLLIYLIRKSMGIQL